MFFSIILLLVSAKDRSHYMKGYFNGRSANVAVIGDLKQGENNLVLFSDNVKNLPEDVSITELGDIVARTYWVGKLNPESKVEVEANLPSASLNLFTFGLDKTELSEETLNELFGSMKQSNLNVPFHPADHTSIVTSAFTGRVPRQHGVVGQTWLERGSEVEAFSNNNRSPAKVGVMNLLRSNYPSMNIVAGSNNQILGRALTQGTTTASSMNQNEFSSSNAKYVFTWAELKTQLTTDPFWVAMKKQVDALDLEDPLVQSFLMEMEYFHRVTENMMQTSEEIQMFNLASTSLENMPELSEDVLLICFATLSNLHSNFKQVFPDGASQMAFIKTPALHETDLHTELESKLAEFKYTPQSVRLRGLEFNQVCTDGLICIMDPSVDVTPGNHETTYQIGVWLCFFCTMAVLFFSCAFCGMDYSSDALLFTKWNRDM
jgi:hypothetical protein